MLCLCSIQFVIAPFQRATEIVPAFAFRKTSVAIISVDSMSTKELALRIVKDQFGVLAEVICGRQA